MGFPFVKEEGVLIPGPAGQIESIVHQGDEAGHFAQQNLLVVICHPHPVHGGTMENKVVTTLMRAYRDLGIHVVRFNFRGVGKSEGLFDNAIGELQDLLAVIVWVKQNIPDTRLLLAGFSFGSSIAAQACYQVDNVRHLALVAPPVERYPYDIENEFPCALVVIQGDRDERVFAEGVYTWLGKLRSPTELLRYPEAGHFFHGYLAQMKSDLTRILLKQLSAF